MFRGLAPENPFPTGINDCWDALRWIAKHASSFGANPNAGFVVGGASAGGNISSILAHLARDEKLDPPLTGQFLCVPALLPTPSVLEKYGAEYISWKENTNDPVLRNGGTGVYDSLEPLIKMNRLSALFTPFANPAGHAGLPPAYIQVCGIE